MNTHSLKIDRYPQESVVKSIRRVSGDGVVDRRLTAQSGSPRSQFDVRGAWQAMRALVSTGEQTIVRAYARAEHVPYSICAGSRLG
jgi:hypothetical protein